MQVIVLCNFDGFLKYITLFYVIYFRIKHLIVAPRLIKSVMDVTFPEFLT